MRAEGSGLMGASGNRDSQLEDSTDDALTITAGHLFQNGTARTLKAC